MSLLDIRRALLSGAALALCCAAVAAPVAPIAPVNDVVETLHGTVVHDPYRYMENVKDPVVQDWLKAQGGVARDALDRIEGRDRLEKRIAELRNAAGDAIYGITRMPGDRVYYFKRPKGERQFKLMVRQGMAGVERVLVDPEVMAKKTGMPHAINYFQPSWDGRYVAYGVSAGGSEDAALYIMDVQTGKEIGEPIPRAQTGLVSWLPDSKSLTFNQMKQPTPGESESEAFLDTTVFWLKVGDRADKAKPIFGPLVTKNLGLARLDVARVQFSPDSQWVLARTTDTTLPEGLLYVAKAADLGTPRIKWTKISGYADKVINIDFKGDDLYFMTPNKSPRRHVMRLDLRRPILSSAVEVAVPPADGVLESFIVNKDAVIGAVRQGTDIVVRRYTAGQPKGEAIAMPFKGAAVVHGDDAHAYSNVLFSLAGWTEQARTFVAGDGKVTDSGLRVNPVVPGLPEVEVVDVQVPSHDGTLVPMTLLFKKGMKLDGNNPTLLNGYAAYGFSQTAFFSAANMVWIENGGVMAYANVRGSGVYGHEWYQAGFKATKPNTWKDGVACAKFLIAKGYASPKTLAAEGGSAGGIFVGRAVTTAPELFAAAIFNVGIMDAVRAEESANGITNISEFGSAKNANEFPALLDMSTYHNIKDGTAYPAVMLVHGLNDPRVDVWHSGKAAARLQAATTSGKPILLRLDAQAGHGIGSTANQRDAMNADIFSFLLWQMGKTTQKAAP